MKPKILQVCYGAGHVSMMVPVFERLLADGKIAPTILPLSIAKAHCVRHGVPCKTLADYGEYIMDGQAERYGKALADRWHVDGSGVTYEESIMYLGVSMRDLVREVGEVEAHKRLEHKGRQCFLPVWTMDKVVEVEEPDLILTTNAPRMERAVTLVGNQRGVRTINLHDDLGYLVRDYVLSADRISVMSEITRDNLVEQGHDSGKIVINGHPAFDAVPHELATLDPGEIRGRYGIPEDKPCLLLGTSMVGERGKIMEITPLVCDAVESMGGAYQLIIKPHPGEDAEAYRRFAEAHPCRPLVVSGVNIRELLHISEMLITFRSTVMIESVLMGKAMVLVNITGQPHPSPFLDWGLGVEVHSAGELAQAVATVADPEFRRGFNAARQRYFGGSTDGMACRRIADLAYELMGI